MVLMKLKVCLRGGRVHGVCEVCMYVTYEIKVFSLIILADAGLGC